MKQVIHYSIWIFLLQNFLLVLAIANQNSTNSRSDGKFVSNTLNNSVYVHFETRFRFCIV